MRVPIYKSPYKFERYYLGEIVDINDTGFRDYGSPLFRVKVKIFGLTDEIPKEYLPWYCVKHPNGQTQNVNGNIPAVGAKVYVELQDIYNGLVSFLIPSPAAELG